MPLSNATQNLLRTQYYDDYFTQSTSEPTKLQGEVFDFHRILFRPRYPVQSRELTQVQTILQAQLERLGKSQFKDGDAVIGGGLTIDTSVTSGKVLATTNLAAFFNRTTNIGVNVFDTANSANRAHVLQFVSADEGTTANYLVYKQQAGGFLPGTVVQATAEVQATFASDSAAEVFNPASIISIDEGIFFVSGFFVRVPQQTIVLSPLSARPSFRIGLTIEEQVLDELDDVVGESLLDPTNDAPGAHRFRIKLTLAKKDLSADADPLFIELVRVIDGVIQRKPTSGYVTMDHLLSILARRTHDESGDYLVKPFTPIIEADPTDETKFLLALGPGKAYVRGFEIETTEPTKLAIRKGRVTDYANNRSIPTTVGNFVYATRVQATAPVNYFANTAAVDLHSVPVGSIDRTSNTTYHYSKIGMAKVRMLETFSVPTDASLHANNSVYKLFFYDVAFNTITGNVASANLVGTTIEVKLNVGAGIPAVNGALDGVTIILSGQSSPVSGTFTIDNYSANSTIAVASLREFLPTLPNGNTAFQLLLQTKDIDSFALYDEGIAGIDPPYLTKLAFQADVDATCKLGGVPDGATLVQGTNDNALLFQIPEMFVKANTISSNAAVWPTWVKTTSNALSMGGATNTVFTVSVSGNTFSLPVGSLSAASVQNLLVFFDTTNDVQGHGVVIQAKDSPASIDRCVSNVVITDAGSSYNIQFNYHHGTIENGTRTLMALAKASVVGMVPRQKSLRIGVTATAVANGSITSGQVQFYSLNATAGFAYSLKTPDVWRIKKVLYKSANTNFTTDDLATATDVTTLFTFDNGQRDNTYEYARLIAKPQTANVVKPTGRLLVIFDWFEHSGRGYCSVDSYLSSVNVGLGMTYDLIPDYTSAKFQSVVNLRDVLDFRPVRSNYEFVNGDSAIFSADSTTANNSYLTSAGESYLFPVSDGSWLGSYQYYLSRIDKIALGYDGLFQVIEGQDAENAKAPSVSSGSLLLFQLTISPYTLVDTNDVPIDVKVKTFDHKRYTMQDLSKIDGRVAHLEYYTALNSLEQITRNENILDSNGNERFKNGILVDSFHGGDVADVANLDHTASIDSQERELRTAFRSFVTQFAADFANSTSTGVTLIGDMAIPSYTVQPFITQPLATHAVSVNPFDVASFYGNLKLSPAVDIWKSVLTKPAQVIDMGGPDEAWVKANYPAFVQWGEWEQTWSGVTSSKTKSSKSTPPGWNPKNHAVGSMTKLTWNEVATAATYQRQGTAYEYTVESNMASLGNRIVDMNIVHNMRGRDVIFGANGMKPQSNVYAFFDGVNVTGYIQQANQIELDEVVGVGDSPFQIGQTVYVQKAMSGTVATSTGNGVVTGANTVFEFEGAVGQRIRVAQGVNTFDSWILEIDSNTSMLLADSTGAPLTLANAVCYTLTPCTVADVAQRITGNNVTYTLKLVKALIDADADSATPYDIVVGAVRPEKQVKDTANTTTGATLLVPPGPRNQTLKTYTITGAVCVSGVVRAYTAGTASLRFDNDITDAKVSTPGTRIYFVGGPGAGQSANVVSYDAASQTAVLDNANLSGIVAGQTIYSVGSLAVDGFTSNVVAGRAGTVAGVFHLQEGQFAVGSRLFRITDSPTNVVADATTSAEANYQASGMSYTQQETSVVSRSLALVRTGPKTESLTVNTGVSVSGLKVQYVDPLAETFLVDATQYPQGVFISSVDLCFAAVPEDDIPVIVELRNVVNGYPSSSEIVPCAGAEGMAVCVLRPDQIVTTAAPTFGGAVHTRFAFPAPVHLMPGREYALVIRSDSNQYTVYTAELGATIIGSDAKVSKQPYAGSFFKSQNASTWSESPFEDLMFRLNRAVWNASASAPKVGILALRAIAPLANTTFDSFELFPHEVGFGSLTTTKYELDIKPLNETTNDLTDSVAIRYTVMPDTWSLLYARSMMQGVGGVDAAALNARPDPLAGPAITPANTIDVLATLTTTSPDVAPYIDLKKFNMLGVRHLINNMELTADNIRIVDPGAGYLAAVRTGTLSANAGQAIVSGNGTTFSTLIAAGDTVVIGGNVEIQVASVQNNTQFTAATNFTEPRVANTWFTYGELGGNNAMELQFVGGSGSGAAGYAVVARNGKIESIVLTSNGAGYVDTTTVAISGPGVGPDGYTLDTHAADLVADSEVAPTGGVALTRYLTRPVTLADGFDARDIQVQFDAYKPANARFHVYYRVLPGDGADTQRFEDQPWRLMHQETPDSVVSTSYYGFKEFKFVTPNGRALDGADDTTDRFKVFAIKVVMASTSTVDAPRLSNFRAIALDE